MTVIGASGETSKPSAIHGQPCEHDHGDRIRHDAAETAQRRVDIDSARGERVVGDQLRIVEDDEGTRGAARLIFERPAP